MGAMIGSPLLLGGDAVAPSYTIDRSVRLRSSASAYFNRTFSSSPTTFTFSCWVKRGILGVQQIIAASRLNGAQSAYLLFNASDQLQFLLTNGTSVTSGYVSTAVFRDPSAWYHVVFSSTAGGTGYVYVNNVQVVSGSVPAGYWLFTNTASWVNAIGRLGDSATSYLDGYLTEINFVDGQALTPSAFGEYDAVRNTQWKPKAYSGSWGTNGFYLKFANPASIGLDSSGNGNNWTASAGIQTSNSALTTYDSMLDVPTLTSESASNFAVLNPLSGLNLGSGNLQVTGSGAGDPHTSTIQIPDTGKWYCEMSSTAYNASTIVGWFGVANRLGGNFSGLLSRVTGAGPGFFQNDVLIAGTNIGALNDVFGVAVDRDAGVVKIYINNVLQATTPTLAAGVDLFFYYGTYTSGTGWVNFGQRPFVYPVPTGYKTLNTYNLPEPAIPSSDDYHKVYTYTGNGGGLQVGEIQKPLSLYNLDRSLRFKGTNSYFDKVFASGGANTKGTFSFWVKRGKLAVQQELIRFGTTGTLFSGLLFNASDQLAFLRLNSTYQVNLVTTRVFRDPNAWYHIVVAWDSTLGPSSNSVKIYINGIQETVFTSSTYPSASLDMYFFTAGTHNIGRYPVGGNYFGGYMAEFHAVDGTQLTANDFGQFDGNYYWTPKDYTGGYGTNGWHLDFEDFSSMSATGIGKDVSGLGNNFTPYNFNVTTPANTNADWDSMVDVPTSISADVANYCTLNPLRSFVSGSAATFTNGNLNVSIPAVANPPRNVTSTLDVFSGKWYWEVIAGTVASNFVTGIASTTMNFNASIFVAGSYLYDATTGNKNIGGTASAYGATYTTNDVIGIALDMDAGTLTFYKNGVSQGVAATGLQGLTVTPVIVASGSSAITGTFNFGQRPFKYSNYGTDRPDATFKPINSFNVAEVTGDLESPDFVWIKSRSAATNHALFNSVTGVGKYLSSNATTTETTDVNSLIQFNKNGFLLGNSAVANTLSATYVASAWKKGATQGLDIVTFTNTSSSASFNHSLGVTPSMIILKGLGPTAANWTVFHKSLANMTTAYLNLNGTPANVGTLGTAVPAPTPTTFGSSSAAIPASQNSIAFLFAEVAGFSKFGSYVGNGSAASPPDGAFVYLGFRPNFVLVKNYAGTAEGWVMWDSSRNTYNTMPNVLYPNLTNAEGSGTNIDFLSNGFKLRNTAVNGNISGNSYIYMAFAEHPFKYALAR